MLGMPLDSIGLSVFFIVTAAPLSEPVGFIATGEAPVAICENCGIFFHSLLISAKGFLFNLPTLVP
jgi:hypothetical protein